MQRQSRKTTATNFCYQPSNVNKEGDNFRPTIFNNIEVTKAKSLNVTRERGQSDGRPINYQGETPNNSITDNLILLAIREIKEEIDERMSVPLALEQNKLIWAKAMMHIKPL